MSRRWPWLAAAVVLVPLALDVYGGRPGQSADAETARLDARLLADPVTQAAETEMRAAFSDLLAASAAPDAVYSSQVVWLRDRLADSADRDKLAATAAAARDNTAGMRTQAAAWRTALAARPDAAELARHCVYREPIASCTVRDAGEVPGSGGTLRYQSVDRFLADQEGADVQPRTAETTWSGQDAMLGTIVQVFAPDPPEAIPSGGWHMVLATQADTGVVPQLANTPSGPVLRIDRPPLDATLYAEQGRLWRVLEQLRWKQDLADRAPRGTCLGDGLYLGRWPWPQRILPELTRIRLDLPSLTADTAFRDGDAVVRTVHATLKIEDGALRLDRVETQDVGRAGWLSRVFARCG